MFTRYRASAENGWNPKWQIEKADNHGWNPNGQIEMVEIPIDK